MPNALVTWFENHVDQIWKAFALIATIILFVAIVVFAGYVLVDHPEASHGPDDMRLSLIVLAGFGLTVALLALLAVAFHVMGVTNAAMPLALPEGSIRALLTFSLVLIFVCVSAFLYSGVGVKQTTDSGITLNLATSDDITDLRTNFVVAAEQAVDQKTGKLLYQQVTVPPAKAGDAETTKDDLKHPFYKVTYYPKQSKDASDFAKQIFTTLATIFISVVSFYFGSSVTSSAVKAGSEAAQAGPDADKTKSALSAANAANAAHTEVQLAQENLDAAKKRSAGEAELAELQTILDTAKSKQQVKQAVATAVQKTPV